MQNSLPVFLVLFKGFPRGSDGKESACNVGGPCSIPRWGRSPEKEIATHSSTLAWAIPWREEPGRLQSMRSQRIRHNRVTITHPLSLLQETFHPGLSLGSLLCLGHTGYDSSSHDIIVKGSFASSGSLLLQISA